MADYLSPERKKALWKKFYNIKIKPGSPEFEQLLEEQAELNAEERQWLRLCAPMGDLGYYNPDTESDLSDGEYQESLQAIIDELKSLKKGDNK